MAHFAQINGTGTVLQVIAVHNNELLIDGVEVEQAGAYFCRNLLGGIWIQTSYNNNFRKQYAGVGYRYDAVANVFIAPEPYPSWSLDENHDWQPPTPRPEVGMWTWNEAGLKWDEQI